MWLVQEKADPRHQVSRLEGTSTGPHSCQHSPPSLAQPTPQTHTQLYKASAKVEQEEQAMAGRGSDLGGVSGRRGAGGVCGRLIAVLAAALALLLCLLPPATAIDPQSTLECHRRQYSYKVHKTDDNGRMCWDVVNVMSCWGRCDSNEIADWKFPYKRSHHPVCIHDKTQLTEVTLRNCDEGVTPGTELYSYHEATRCACAVCKSSQASCEGLRYRGARRAPRAQVPRG
ncbi:hypothetical protein O3P69_008888 [Scylla paramamosain]|uniref:Glycoprotein hormone subunit beta domain-containing protein n=1 Tax=Scylla paramamosain TaxID=85552 RepID=A0AAW0TPS1_SCYPA